MQKPTVALAFSGGLDTSYCVPRLAEQGFAVHTVYVNTGGSSAEDLAAIAKQARAVGAVDHHEVDARSEVFSRFVRYLIQGNVLRGEVYPLSVSAERTQQAISVIDVARQIGARAVAHGSTGAGNDQVRFDVAFRVLAPDLRIITPIRDEGLTRDRTIAYLESHNLPVPPKSGAYSINRGLWGTTWGGGWTHDTWAPPPDELLEPPADAPAPRDIVIAWKDGVPLSIDGNALEGSDLVAELGKLTEAYGIGRNIHVGETALGIKGRIGFEWYYTGEQRLEANPFRTQGKPYMVFGALVERRFGRYRLFINGENLADVRQTDWDPLIRPARGVDGRWTVDAWAPLEGRNINGGVRIEF